jgi:hypothetical protein
MALGLAARTHEIGYTFELDEISSLQFASGTFSDTLTRSLQDTPHPPLHNILLHGWIKLFGPSETSIRSLSVVMFVPFVFCCLALFRRCMTLPVAYGVLTIIAISPFFSHYGQLARPYALIALLSVLNMTMFVRLLERGHSWARATAWGCSGVALMYSQYFGAVLIAVELGILLLLRSAPRLRFLMVGAGAVASIVPWGYVAMGAALARGADPLPQIGWMSKPSPADALWYFTRSFGEVPNVQIRWLLAVLAGISLGGVALAIKRRKLGMPGVFLLGATFGLPAVAYLVSVLGPKPIFEARQLIGGQVALLALLGLLLSQLQRFVAAAAAILLVVWAALAWPNSQPHIVKPPWREVVAYVESLPPPRRVLVAEEWVRVPLRHYGIAARVVDVVDVRGALPTESLVYVCRPVRCPGAGANNSLLRQSLLRKFSWGLDKSSSSETLQVLAVAM